MANTTKERYVQNKKTRTPQSDYITNKIMGGFDSWQGQCPSPHSIQTGLGLAPLEIKQATGIFTQE